MPETLPWLDALAGWPGARWLQGSGTAYLIVNALHILGIGLLVGAILPLDLRLAGFFRRVPLVPLVSVLPIGRNPSRCWVDVDRPRNWMKEFAFRSPGCRLNAVVDA